MVTDPYFALERTGVNAIPEALADELARRTGFPVDASIVQVAGDRCNCLNRENLTRRNFVQQMNNLHY